MWYFHINIFPCQCLQQGFCLVLAIRKEATLPPKACGLKSTLKSKPFRSWTVVWLLVYPNPQAAYKRCKDNGALSLHGAQWRGALRAPSALSADTWPGPLQSSELAFLYPHLDILLKIMTNSLIIPYSTKHFNMRTDTFSLSRALNSFQNISWFTSEAAQVNICLMIQDCKIPSCGQHGGESGDESPLACTAQDGFQGPRSDSLCRNHWVWLQR